jgi:hypothetical protein
MGRRCCTRRDLCGQEVLYWEGPVLARRCCTGTNLFLVVGAVLRGICLKKGALNWEGSVLIKRCMHRRCCTVINLSWKGDVLREIYVFWGDMF